MPNSASRIRVNTLAVPAPPCARIASRAVRMCAASGASPASFSAKYAFTLALMLNAPPWNERPAAMRALPTPQIARELPLDARLALAEEVLQQRCIRPGS